MTHCSVCSAEASKYKCTACKAQSCSLPCFKTHAAQCTAEPPVQHSKTTEPVTEVPTTTKKLSPEGQPYYPSREELSGLFKRYPTLRGQLQDIYNATQRPAEPEEGNKSFRGGFNARGRGRGSHGFDGTRDSRAWTPDKGFDRGLRQLQTTLEQDSSRSEALWVFADLTLKTKSNENEQHMTDS